LQHRGLWFGAVVKQVGGVVENRVLGGREGESFSRITREQQQKAVRFLLDHAFQTPKKLLNPTIVNRFKYAGVADEVMAQQKTLLTSLLSGRRFRLLLDAEVVNHQKTYTALQFLTDVQDGVWVEVKQSQPVVDAVRRSLQRNYLEHLKSELKPKEPTTEAPRTIPRRGGDTTLAEGSKGTDFRAVARAALQDLASQLESLLRRSPEGVSRIEDAMTRAHLADCLREIKLILNPKE
jgi:hypothetical protein